MLKRIISSVMAVVLISSLLTGCGQGSKESEKPEGLDKMGAFMEAIGYRILEADDYIPDTEWRTIAIVFGMDYKADYGRGSYKIDDETSSVIVPAADVREFYAALKADFDGNLPEITDPYLVTYDEDKDVYLFGMGDFGIDIPVCDGYRKYGEGYQALCGSEYEDPETGKIVKHDSHGLVTLVHNKYSDSVDDPMFTWSVSEVKVIGREEYEKLLPEFSK